MISKLRSIYKRFFRKKICTDCKIKLDKHFGLKSRIKHRLKKHRWTKRDLKKRSALWTKRADRTRSNKRRSSIKRKLKAGVHMVKIKGGKMRKVRVLSNGQWRFMKK